MLRGAATEGKGVAQSNDGSNAGLHGAFCETSIRSSCTKLTTGTMQCGRMAEQGSDSCHACTFMSGTG